jgi:hypothetical protein
MNREPDFDSVVTSWIDEGADRAPERFVWAAIEDVERTPQRGAWVASTEEYLMQLKRAAPVLGIAAAIVLAIVAFQIVGTRNVGDPDPTPRAYAPEDLETIVISEANAPTDVDVGNTTTGLVALSSPLHPGGDTIDTSEFVDAINTELSFPDGGYATWAALFETEEAAMQAFDFLVEEHESPDGWNLDEGTPPDPPLGDESVVWTGQQYDFESARTLFWRQGTLLLAVVGWVDWTDEQVREIADGMADRAK